MAGILRDIRAAIKTERYLIAESVDILKRHVQLPIVAEHSTP